MVRIIEEEIAGSFYSSKQFDEYFGGMKLAAADIETTGLSPRTSAVILGGAVVTDGDRRLAVQFFADSEEDEPELLERYVSLLCKNDVIVTYNGASFDIAFLVKRLRHRGMDSSGLESLYSLDMYRILKKHSHLPDILPDMKQKTVEKYLGHGDSRKDRISGAQSAELYSEYTASAGSRREEILDIILLHNRDDIVRLSDMLRIFKILDMHKIMFTGGFLTSKDGICISVDRISLKKCHLRAEGRVMGRDRMPACRLFGEGLSLEISGSDGSLTMDAICEEVEGFSVADLAMLGADDMQMQSMGGYESGYLILSGSDAPRYREINTLVRKLIWSMIERSDVYR